nr:fasciclin domain-containing protein [Nakamurella antarctica]
MSTKFLTRGIVAAVAGTLLALTAACGSSDSTAASSSMTSATSAASSSAAAAPSSSAEMTTSAAMAGGGMVGAGCAAYAAANPSGAGSVDGMAADPVAVAAGNNPILTTLTAAVSGKLNPKVDLVNTLNGAEFTVFAPVDDAFAKIDKATIETLKTDDALLSKILTYHVVPGQIAPDAIVGTHTTVEGQDLTVTGSGDNLKINGESAVICGGVKTKNATVYLIDTVLMPPAADAATPAASADMTTSMAAAPMDNASGLVGTGCAAYASANPSGAGSVDGMAADPVAVAAGNNPILKTLTAAVSGKLNPKVDLVNTLNGGEFTVFAPVDDAFGKIDPATIETLKTDDALLSKILTYHVIPGQIAADAIVGTHTTVEGQDLVVTGTPDKLMVNGQSAVICGGVKTKNATVYLIDTVLMPPAA